MQKSPARKKVVSKVKPGAAKSTAGTSAASDIALQPKKILGQKTAGTSGKAASSGGATKKAAKSGGNADVGDAIGITIASPDLKTPSKTSVGFRSSKFNIVHSYTAQSLDTRTEGLGVSMVSGHSFDSTGGYGAGGGLVGISSDNDSNIIDMSHNIRLIEDDEGHGGEETPPREDHDGREGHGGQTNNAGGGYNIAIHAVDKVEQDFKEMQKKKKNRRITSYGMMNRDLKPNVGGYNKQTLAEKTVKRRAPTSSGPRKKSIATTMYEKQLEKTKDAQEHEEFKSLAEYNRVVKKYLSKIDETNTMRADMESDIRDLERQNAKLVDRNGVFQTEIEEMQRTMRDVYAEKLQVDKQLNHKQIMLHDLLTKCDYLTQSLESLLHDGDGFDVDTALKQDAEQFVRRNVKDALGDNGLNLKHVEECPRSQIIELYNLHGVDHGGFHEIGYIKNFPITAHPGREHAKKNVIGDLMPDSLNELQDAENVPKPEDVCPNTIDPATGKVCERRVRAHQFGKDNVSVHSREGIRKTMDALKSIMEVRFPQGEIKLTTNLTAEEIHMLNLDDVLIPATEIVKDKKNSSDPPNDVAGSGLSASMKTNESAHDSESVSRHDQDSRHDHPVERVERIGQNVGLAGHIGLKVRKQIGTFGIKNLANPTHQMGTPAEKTLGLRPDRLFLGVPVSAPLHLATPTQKAQNHKEFFRSNMIPKKESNGFIPLPAGIKLAPVPRMPELKKLQVGAFTRVGSSKLDGTQEDGIGGTETSGTHLSQQEGDQISPELVAEEQHSKQPHLFYESSYCLPHSNSGVGHSKDLVSQSRDSLSLAKDWVSVSKNTDVTSTVRGAMPSWVSVINALR